MIRIKSLTLLLGWLFCFGFCKETGESEWYRRVDNLCDIHRFQKESGQSGRDFPEIWFWWQNSFMTSLEMGLGQFDCKHLLWAGASLASWVQQKQQFLLQKRKCVIDVLQTSVKTFSSFSISQICSTVFVQGSWMYFLPPDFNISVPKKYYRVILAATKTISPAEEKVHDQCAAILYEDLLQIQSF